jgi:hypothetical protein
LEHSKRKKREAPESIALWYKVIRENYFAAAKLAATTSQLTTFQKAEM